MIDWFRGEIPFLHDPLPAGRVLSIESDGEIEWEAPKKLTARGSHESSIKIRSHGGDGNGFATSLMIDGNLAKFLQGHNVFGSRDLNKLVFQAFQNIYWSHIQHFDGWSSPELTEQKILRGDYLVKMLDVNQLYDLGNDASVESWLHAAEMRARTRSGRATRERGTVYLAKNSRRWAFKFYNKKRELLARGKSHQLPEQLQGAGLDDYVDGKLRAELRLMSLELKDLGITHGYHVTEARLASLFNDYIGRIDMNTQVTLIDNKLLELPRTVQATHQLWKQGASLSQLLTPPTFYRHRRILLESGIDISVPPASLDHSNVVPLIRVIEAKPVEIPQWAYDKKLIVV